jgi:hypothetical protein
VNVKYYLLMYTGVWSLFRDRQLTEQQYLGNEKVKEFVVSVYRIDWPIWFGVLRRRWSPGYQQAYDAKHNSNVNRTVFNVQTNELMQVT